MFEYTCFYVIIFGKINRIFKYNSFNSNFHKIKTIYGKNYLEFFTANCATHFHLFISLFIYSFISLDLVSQCIPTTMP